VQVAISSDSIVGVYFHPESTIYNKGQLRPPYEHRHNILV
jgi:anthranilate/para-aminobenzoate synthase component II